MSLFSRFRKTPPPATAKKPSPTVPTDAAAPAIADASAADAARIAAQDEEAVTAAISAGDAQTLARLAIEGASTRIRQRAAEAIEDPDQIRRLIKGARGGNDKNVYKILTRKRDAVLAHEREQEQLHAEISAISAAIERHSRRPFDPLFAPSLEQLENRWNVVASHAASDIAQTTQQAIDRAREVIAQHLREVAAKAARELTAANEAAAAQKQREEQEQAAKLAAAERAQTAEEQRRAQAEKLDAQAQSLRQIGGLLRKAQGALASGSSKTAAGLRRAIEEKLTTAPPLPAHLANQLKQLDAKLEELKDWKSFSVAPKRIELIEQMESLIGATLHPTALAGHIKDLQEQWRTLSKGAAEDADIESEWQRFHEAAQKAFQPCREYFEAQDQIKQENLRQRGELFERLAAFEARQNWEEEPDWRTVITAVREARQMWRQYAPVDLAQGEELQTRFNELTASLQGRIDAEYARNVKQKNSLIERARASLSLDSRAAIDEVKRLQEIWKSIGPVPRDQDRTLWENFREQCDAVFQKRQQELATQNAQFETSRSQAIALCEELEKIAGLSDRELLEGAKKLPELRAAFDAIEDLPRAHVRQLQDRFERAFERCRKAVTQQQAQEAERGWIDLLDAANLVRAYRLAVAQQENTAELEALKQSAEERLANAVQSPKRGVEVLKTSLAQQGSNDLPANELALRTLCVRAEILTDTPSPADDQALRRELQVKRLMQSMGQGVKADAGELDTMMIEWLGVGPIEESTYLTLADRFKECRRRALASRSRS